MINLMIVFNYKKLDDFLAKMVLRMGNTVFTQYIEPSTNPDLSENRHKLILQFLGYPSQGNTDLNILHQISLGIKSSAERDEVIVKMKKAFEKIGDISIVEGYINEIFMSIS